MIDIPILSPEMLEAWRRLNASRSARPAAAPMQPFNDGHADQLAAQWDNWGGPIGQPVRTKQQMMAGRVGQPHHGMTQRQLGQRNLGAILRDAMMGGGPAPLAGLGATFGGGAVGGFGQPPAQRGILPFPQGQSRSLSQFNALQGGMPNGLAQRQSMQFGVPPFPPYGGR